MGGSDLVIPDISEYQSFPQGYAAIRAQAITVRLSQGVYLDTLGRANRDAFRAATQIQALGFYHYLTAGDDPVAQANVFAAEVGALRPNEWIACDDEEGGGDQSPRVNAFLDRCDALLRKPSADFVYSGQYFMAAHLGGVRADVHRWMAAYSASEPGDAHELWQFTSGGHCDGISDPCDLSIFHGNIQQFLALIGATPGTGGTLDMGFVVVTDGPDQHPGGEHGAVYFQDGIYARWLGNPLEMQILGQQYNQRLFGSPDSVPFSQAVLDRMHQVEPTPWTGANIVEPELYMLRVIDAHLTAMTPGALTADQAKKLQDIQDTVHKLPPGGLTPTQAAALVDVQSKIDRHLAA